MKRKQIIFMVVFLTFMAGNLYSQMTRISPISVINKEFKILKIDSIRNVYVIYAEQNDSVFRILSKKEKVCNCRYLELNDLYVFSIKSLFLPEEVVVMQRIAGVRYEGSVIPIKDETDEKNVLRDLYLSNDIKGKCYIREDEK